MLQHLIVIMLLSACFAFSDFGPDCLPGFTLKAFSVSSSVDSGQETFGDFLQEAEEIYMKGQDPPLPLRGPGTGTGTGSRTGTGTVSTTGPHSALPCGHAPGSNARMYLQETLSGHSEMAEEHSIYLFSLFNFPLGDQVL